MSFTHAVKIIQFSRFEGFRKWQSNLTALISDASGTLDASVIGAPLLEKTAKCFDVGLTYSWLRLWLGLSCAIFV